MRTLVLLCLAIASLYSGVDATLKIEKDVDTRAKIAIVDSSKSASKMATESFKILRDDLKITGHFLPNSEYLTSDYESNTPPKTLNPIEYALKYKIAKDNNNVLLAIKLLKIINDKSDLILEKRYKISSLKRYPFLIHKAVSDINDILGFESVAWINRYVLFAKYSGKKSSEVGVADYTFHYQKIIIKGGLNLFPVWGDSEQKSIYFTDYSGDLPTLMRLDLIKGKLTKITTSQGMLVCSDVSKDGKRLLLTMAPNGQPDIYEYFIDSKRVKRLTKFSGIDVGGKYADNEKSIVFISNRLGYPTIYKKPLNGGVTIQLVYHGHNNNSCDAFDKKVVYSSRDGAKSFNLYLTAIDGSYTLPLTTSGINQFPRFSPNGNTVLYINRSANGNSIGYIGLKTNMRMLFPLGISRLQSIDW